MAVTFGRYRLERWLAQGGMANIFLATYVGPLGFEREVVLKVILPEYAHNPEYISMFLDEARLAARFNHPNIVEVFDLGQVGGYFFIAMEFLRGASLSRMLIRGRREGRTLSPQLSLFIISELLEALAYAHGRRMRDGQPLGLVHRDINPQNLLISFDGLVKLTDFGVAISNANIQSSKKGVIIGKYSHMAPEQCQGKDVDERADLFAVGVMLHELLTGKPLFTRPSPAEMIKAVLEEPVPTPSSVSSRSPRELDLVVMKALARSRTERYPNAIAFLEALQVVARPLGLLATRHDLRNYMTTLFRKGRNNLAGEEEQGMVVTEDRISDILRGLNSAKPAGERTDGSHPSHAAVSGIHEPSLKRSGSMESKSASSHAHRGEGSHSGIAKGGVTLPFDHPSGLAMGGIPMINSTDSDEDDLEDTISVHFQLEEDDSAASLDELELE